MKLLTAGLVALGLISSYPASAAEAPRAGGPLRVHPKNPRYFTDGSGRAIFLTGSHTWANLQDQGPKDPPTPFDFDRYLDFLRDRNHNVIRLWAWEQARWAPWSDGKGHNPNDWFIEPNPYVRSGPGKALDGKPKFDLSKFDKTYFDRLRTRVRQAGERGIYVSVMLFQGWSSAKSWLGGKPWRGHPYHPDNNVQGFNGNTKNDIGPDLADPKVRDRQAAYIRKVIDTLNDLDNVLYEVTNEGGDKAWDRFVVDAVHAYEKTKPKQHPVGLTGHGSESNDEMLASTADWFSPGSKQWPDLKSEPRAVDGAKISMLDTDHVFGVGGDQKWVWKAFLRGHNVLFMDPYDDPAWEPVLAGQRVGVRDAEAPRRAMGHAHSYASRIDLAASRPAGELASTGYCLAVPGREYLVYLPDGGAATIDLSAAKGRLSVEWMHPVTGKITRGEAVEGGAERTLKAPSRVTPSFSCEPLLDDWNDGTPSPRGGGVPAAHQIGRLELDAVRPGRVAPERHGFACGGVAGRDRQAADQFDGGLRLGLGHQFVADQVPIAALGVAADHMRIARTVEPGVRRAGRQNHDVARCQLDDRPPLAAKLERDPPPRHPERLVAGRMEVEVVVDAQLAPVVQPVVPPERRLDRVGEVLTVGGLDDAPMDQHGEPAVGNQAVGLEMQRFEARFCFRHGFGSLPFSSR